MRPIIPQKLLTYFRKHQTETKNRLVFLVIFLVISVPLTILFFQAYQKSTALEEKSISEDISAAYKDFNSKLIVDYNIEDSRSFKDYGQLATINMISGRGNFFPDSSSPYCAYNSLLKHCSKGLVGNFQISHNGEMLTPFLPDTNNSIGKTTWERLHINEKKARINARDKIQYLLSNMDFSKQAFHPEAVPNTDFPEPIDIDLWYTKNPDMAAVTRVELSSEEDVLSYIAQVAIQDSIYIEENSSLSAKLNSVDISSFKMQIVEDYFVFYRKITIGKLSTIQGFVVDISSYLDRVLQDEQQQFLSEDQPYYIELVSGDKVIMNFGTTSRKSSLKRVEALQKPFENIQFKMYTNRSVYSNGSTILLTGFILLFVIAIGLITIYRFTQSKIALASKRQDFVSAVTHELKTPLTAIKMYAELLQNSWVVSEEKKQKYYNQIASEADRLSRLIQNVLNLSKLDGNRWNVQLRKERPKAVLDDFIATYSKNVEKHGFELTVSSDTDANNISLLIDRDAIMQILMNLVDNSLKFSKNAEYKMINIELAIKGTDMYLAVRDYGPGIPAGEMKKVFQEFYRVENEMTRQTSGTGIGLSMVKKLCSLTNMEIELENANPGLRTKIHFPSLSI